MASFDEGLTQAPTPADSGQVVLREIGITAPDPGPGKEGWPLFLVSIMRG